MKELLKKKACIKIEKHATELVELTRLLRDHPETGFQEYKAVTWLSGYLQKKRFCCRKRNWQPGDCVSGCA